MDVLPGSIPQYYRDVYDTIDEQITFECFVRLFSSVTNLNNAVLGQIWTLVDKNHKFLQRNSLFKALYLIALVQQGKSIDERSLYSTHTSSETLAKPILGDLNDFRLKFIRIKRDLNPTCLGYDYNELCLLNTINLEIVPEKKGLIVKHIEYELSSLKHKTKVLRRYTDFVTLHELLLQKYPYRIVPALPPKHLLNMSKDFIEQRRKALKRYLQLITRHPALSDCDLVKYFLTHDGHDISTKMKDNFCKYPDEYMTHPSANTSKEHLSIDTSTNISISKQHIFMLLSSFNKIKEIMESIIENHRLNKSNMIYLGNTLNNLSNDQTQLGSWTLGTNDTWSTLKTGLKPLSLEFTHLSDSFETITYQHEELVVEQMSYFLDLVNAYRDLCTRHEKGLIHDHSKSLIKMNKLKSKHVTSTNKMTNEAVEQLETRIIKQENEIYNLEARNAFAQLCLQLDTQLVHANLEVILHALNSFISIEAKGHGEIADVWRKILPKIEALLSTK